MAILPFFMLQTQSSRPPSGFAALGRLGAEIALKKTNAISAPSRLRLISQPVGQRNTTISHMRTDS